MTLAPVVGYLNNQGKLEYFLTTWFVFILIALELYLLLRKTDSQVVIAS